jgi:hypothetical protein
MSLSALCVSGVPDFAAGRCLRYRVDFGDQQFLVRPRLLP